MVLFGPIIAEILCGLCHSTSRSLPLYNAFLVGVGTDILFPCYTEVHRASRAGFAWLICQLFVLRHSAHAIKKKVAVLLWYRHVKFNTRHPWHYKLVFWREHQVVRILMPCQACNLRFWLSAWRKWRNLNSTLTTSGTLKVRIGEYK